MTEITAAEKGDALEQAVRYIEGVIIGQFPGYSKDTFEIEGKKIVVVAGVRHEIDVYVRLRHGGGYDSVFVFECRNRQEKVSKNDIIVFIEKIRVTQAQ